MTHSEFTKRQKAFNKLNGPKLIGHINLEETRSAKELKAANSRRNAWLSS